MLRGLLDDSDPRVHPDGLETLNPTMLGRPWHARVVRFADQHGLAHLGNSDAHAIEAIATGWTTFPGSDGGDLRRAIETRHDRARRLIPRHRRASSATSGGSCASGPRTPATSSRGRLRRDGTGRDHGYPGGRLRPPRYEPAGAGETDRRRDEDRPGLPVHLPGIGRRRPARQVPVREPPPARPRRPDHHRQPRSAARVRGRHPADRGRASACRPTARSGR